MSAKYLFAVALSIALISTARGFGFDSVLDQGDEADTDQEGRLILPLFFAGTSNGQLAPLNISNAILGLLALAAAALLPLLGLCALGLLLWALLSQNDSGGYSSGGYGSHSAYSSSSYKRSFDPSHTDWEKLSILDWISVAHDAYSNFDPTDVDCQKKIICEVHQNTEKFGPAAETLTNWFSYLKFAEVMALPYEMKALVDDLMDAAEQGRSLKKDCSEIFSHCIFSVKAIMEKYRPHLLNYVSTNNV